jgi:D-3-phosphoglycerate dehydrogenase / 2-oxoglutarate reductase
VSGSRSKILVAESSGFSSEAAALLREQGELVLADVDRTGLLSAVKEADVLWVRLRHQIDAEVLAAASRLKIIVTPTTGLNHIDLKEAQRRDIKVLSLQGETEFLKDIRATAEHTVGLMLALLRRVPAAVDDVKKGNWDRDRFKGRELFGKTIGIVGHGRLGRIVGKYLRAFDARILVSDPHVDQETVDSGLSVVGLDDLLHESDIVSLHVSLSDRTQSFFGKEQFSRMKAGAWFINSARGELIDETALLDVLRNGHLAGAAVDVLCDEQFNNMQNHPLVSYAQAHDNLLITPHIGGCTVESMEKTEVFMAKKLSSSIKSVITSASSSWGN